MFATRVSPPLRLPSSPCLCSCWVTSKGPATRCGRTAGGQQHQVINTVTSACPSSRQSQAGSRPVHKKWGAADPTVQRTYGIHLEVL